ncbi:hypothetical protein FGB62_249g03 [Gracilaria domingensis]|nr:hypothetical protein FGB62_249g03 [Gracilaria domingensis]
MVHAGHPENCVICQDTLEGHVVKLECPHVFHYDCISPILPEKQRDPVVLEIRNEHLERLDVREIHPAPSVCPLCRSEIDTEKLTHYVDYEKRRDRTFSEHISVAEMGRRIRKNKKRMERHLRKKQEQNEKRKNDEQTS